MKLGKTYFSGSLTFDEGNNRIGPNSSVLTGSLSGSVKGTFEGSFVGNTLTNISGAFDSVSSSLAQNIETRLLNTTDTLTGDLTVTGTLTAQDLVVQEITSSVIYSSGSNLFGNDSANIHTFTGSIALGQSSNIVDSGLSHYTNGYVYLRGGTGGAAMITDAAGTTSGFYANDGGTAVITTADVDRMTVDSSGNVTFTKPDDLRLTLTDSGDSSSIVLRADAVNEIYTGTNHDLQIYTNGNQNGQIYLKQSDGAVGIGNTSPQNKVDIYSNENVPLRIHRPSNANLDSSGAWGIGFSTRGDALTSTDDVKAGIFSYYTGNLFFATNTTDIEPDPDASARMSILNNGNTSIGRTVDNVGGAPGGTAGRLNVYTDAGSNVWAQQIRHDSTTGNGLFIRAGASNSYYTAYFAGYDENNSHFIIRGDGKIGIGTNDPSANGLHIEKSGNHLFLRASTATAGKYWNFDITSANQLYIVNNGGAGMTILDNGNVGIGTTSAQALLHLRADAPYIYFDDTSTTGTRTRFQLVNGDVGTTQSAIFSFNNTSGTSLLDVLTMNENGVVGIGTNNPDQKPKLHVYNNTDDGDYGTKIQAIFGNRGYLDSDANNIFGSGTSETQFLNGSSSRPAMISLGGDLGPNETVGVINFFRNSNSQGYRSRALIDCGVLNNGTADQHGGRLRFWTANDGSTNPGVRLIILEDGKVGIGTQSPSAPLQVNGQQKWYTTNSDGNELRGFFNPGGAADDATFTLYKADGSTAWANFTSNALNIGPRTYNVSTGFTIFGSTGTIQSDINANSTGYEVLLINNRTSGGTASVLQYRTNGTVEGSIIGNASGLSISNNSDYRKKTEIRDLSGSLAVVDSLQPRLYKYREGFGKPTDKDFVGFIAHEIQDIFPDSVNNNRDDVYTQEDIDNGVTGFNVGDPKYQTVAYSSNEIITHLVGAIKELKAEIDALKNA